MKKLISVFAAVLLLCAMAFTVSAAGGISATNAVGSAGQTVSIPVSLAEKTEVDSIVVQYSYDDKYLIPQNHEWKLSGPMGSFGGSSKAMKNKGIWASEKESEEVQGEICVLSFQIKSGVSFDATEVKCTVILALNDKRVGEYSTTAQVMTSCSHSYGAWKSRDNTSHDRFCGICNDKQSGTHDWDEGKLTADPDNSNNALMVHTCSVCGGTKSFVIEDADVPVTQPAQNDSQSGQQQGNQQQGNQQQGNQQQGNQQPTQPQENQQGDQFGDPNNQQQENQGGQQGDHTHENTTPVDPFTGLPEGTQPQQEQTQPTNSYVDYNEPEHTHAETTVPQYIELDHDHDHSGESVGDAATPIVIVAAVAVLVGALVFFVKKKW